MDTMFDLMLWRDALADAPAVPTISDLRDWARLLDGAGEAAAARLLGDVAATRLGVSPASTGAASAGDWTIDKAIGELRDLARDFAPSLIPPPRPLVSGRPDAAAGIGPAVPIAPPLRDIAETTHRLRALLDDPAPGEAGLAELATLLSGLVEAERRLPALDYRRHADAPLPRLAGLIALSALTFFALGTRDLARAPLGSPAFLHRVARLDRVGLGPWFGNVERIVRTSADVYDLARIAADASAGRSGERAWIVLLARGSGGRMRNEIIDDIADSGDGELLTAMFDRAASRPAPAIEPDLLMRLRDAALDNADHRLAARAQTLIATLRPSERLERIILGSIQATGGDFGAAEETFRACLIEAPGDADLHARLIAARDGDFTGYEVARGFGSPQDRVETRLRRRGVAPHYGRRAGVRIQAVDVS